MTVDFPMLWFSFETWPCLVGRYLSYGDDAQEANGRTPVCVGSH